MISYGVTDIQSKPSLIKSIDIGQIVDKRKHKTVGYFISSKYEDYLLPIIEEISKKEKIKKLKRLKAHQDLELAELGVDDGL